jgi:hypothetical protein
MKQNLLANVAVKPNVWCAHDVLDPDDTPYFLQEIIPGDLLVEFLRTRDVRTLRSTLTTRQQVEYQQSRFFQHHGQKGLAFEDL